MRIEHLTRYGTAGWAWVQAEREWHTGRIVRESYRTNGNGDGLWRETTNAYGSYEGWRQVVGTAQLSIPASSSAARRAIRRYAEWGDSLNA